MYIVRELVNTKLHYLVLQYDFMMPSLVAEDTVE
jgi:hypothetical protein